MEENKKQSTIVNSNEKQHVKEDNKILEKNENSKFSNTTNKQPFNPKTKFVKQSTTGYEEKVVGVKRISKTTKGGRSMRFSALVVIGDKKGIVGFGIGKSIEVPVAIKKALKSAKNNIVKVKMTKKSTVFHEIISKYGAGKVLLKPAVTGTGIIAGGPIKVVLELAGFKDVYSKNLGKNTSLNMIRATVKGLLSQKTPKEIAHLRDKTLSEL